MGIYVYCRRLGGLLGSGSGFSAGFWMNLEGSAAKRGVWRGVSGLVRWPLVVENGRILIENDGF